APSELRWLGRLGLPGLFDGEHRFVIESDGAGGSVLTQSETFRGLLVPLVWRGLGPRTEAAFHRMNEALRDRVEPPVLP
ncbi:MAG TPA: SRPBCC domain-containing protein, partial [Thermoplasmata archaeon]|nr:SRPBCC domain-containing protein [Thermoplasmata archaeon]